MSSIDSYVKIQEDILERLSKGINNFKKSPKERITMSYIETRLETLEQQYKLFINTHHKLVYETKREELEQSTYSTEDIYDQTEEKYIQYKALLKESLSKFKANKSNNGDESNKGSDNSVVRLPKINIPKFSGNYLDWISFRDLFLSLIHNNKGIDDVQKLHYLKGCISGEAELLLKHIPVTADNYKVCWQQLEGRYDNKKFLSNSILKRLVSQKQLTNESASGLKQLLDTTKECLNALTNLGIDISTWDIIIIFLMSQKLDPESRKAWEQKTSESATELPNLNQFEEFLETRFRSLEFIDPKLLKTEKSNCTHVATTIVSCSFCSENHRLCNCKKFSKEDVDVRRNFVQTQHLCFNCFNPDHSVYQCNNTSRCRLCKKKHHSLLHPKSQLSAPAIQSADSKIVTAVAETSSLSQTPGESSHSNVLFSNTHSQVLLATALVKVESPKNKTAVVLRSLLDQGSQASFITEAAVQMLGLQKIPGTNLVSGLGGDQDSTLASKSSVLLKLQSRLDPTFTIQVKAHVLTKLTSFLPSKKVVIKVLPATLPTMRLADPSFATPNKIDLLLGAEVYSQILLEGMIKGPPGSVVAQHTRLGWILSGAIHGDIKSNHSETCHNTVISLHITRTDEDELLKKFWELQSEPFPPVKRLTEEEQRCEVIFSQTTQRDDSGRYIVKLPFKMDDPPSKYGGSKAIANKRFLMLEKRLIRNPNLRMEYSKVINEYLQLGHMEVIHTREIGSPDAVYLPHHAVVRQDKTTTKVRVVFDASCVGTNGASLNNDLMVGPTLQPDLRHLVMRWRRYPISLVADIVKMYRQVKVAPEDTDFQRIFWRENPETELQHLRLLRVTFGTSAAPYLAVRCLQQLAVDEGSEFPLASSRVLNDFYMDDLMTGCYSVHEGTEIYKEMNALLQRGGFPLQKWASNSRDLMKELKEEQKELRNLEIKTDEIMKILGLTWDRESDEFRCSVTLTALEAPVTKRKVISDIARLFDPLGWLAPVITTAKIFIQQIWLSGIEWDDELPSSLLKDWLTFRSNLSELTKIRIPRWIHSSQDDICFELHGFSDASNAAYAAVVYSRVIDKHGKVYVQMITSKTRVAPIKQVSIPRLELCGAVLLAKLLREVAEVLDVPKRQLHAWTDSSIVLAWLSSHPNRWKTFIANRVSEILTIMDADQWSHVASSQNPADSASRGVQPAECVDSRLWNEGPNWLQAPTINYAKKVVTDTKLEEKKPKIICHTISTAAGYDILSKYSSLTKLLRVISFCRRTLLWKKSETKREQKLSKYLTIEELNKSMLTCIKLCQGQHYSEEISSLETKGEIHKKSRLAPLSPFLDSDRVLRVSGRLHSAQFNEDMKHPIIMPNKSHFTTLLIKDAHAKTMHGGPQLMLNYLRTKYWVIGSKNLVKQFVRKCVTCIRHSARTTQQMMGRLPTSRVTAHRPFFRSGVDYAGPINVRTTKGRGHRSTKGYICLFICMATRAIHLEMVSDLTSQAFLAAFKRFVARRGHVAELWSDNGTTFVGSAKELIRLFDAERLNIAGEIVDWLSSNGTAWHFIPPYSPNFGGLWEAGIKSTKHHLKRVIGTSTLTFEEMTTTLSQIEACLNSRPLSHLSSNPEDPCPLTPGHFLVGEPLVLVPELNYESSTITCLKRWHLTQRLVQEFWRRWSREYLGHLQHRYKWSSREAEPEIGDVVLVKEENLPPARWLLGRIVEKFPGPDNLTRVVNLKYKTSIIKRPVSKIIVLPVKD